VIMTGPLALVDDIAHAVSNRDWAQSAVANLGPELYGATARLNEGRSVAIMVIFFEAHSMAVSPPHTKCPDEPRTSS